MAFPLLPLIGMGVQAIGAFLSANQASEAEKARAEAASKPQTTTTSIDFVAMRKAAEEAGFNPLSALRSGAAAGFMQTSSQVSYPVLSSISPFGEGLQAIGGALSAFQWDPLADQRAAVEYDIAKETLTNLRGQNMSFQVPSYQGSSRVRTSGGFAVAEPEPLIAARVGGIQVQPASGWSNAQEIEDRYGDGGVPVWRWWSRPTRPGLCEFVA